jgi:hypothetical protein
MFRRGWRRPGDDPVDHGGTKSDAIGIGAQVIIRADPRSLDEWDGEPSGVVVAPGENEIAAYPGLTFGGPTRWLVVFDELQFTSDGRGPFEQATVGSWRLAPAPHADTA